MMSAMRMTRRSRPLALALGLSGLLTSCITSNERATPNDRETLVAQESPLLALPKELRRAVGPWFDADGKQLPSYRPFVMIVVQGSEHCHWDDQLFLYMSLPLGKEIRNPSFLKGNERVFVRLSSTENMLPSDFATAFDADAPLPASAYDTGYHRKGWHLWVAEERMKRAVWLVHGDSVERWPAARTPIVCI
jgi:hypothetical protein